MKYKHIIILFALAFILDVIGAVLKITHFELAFINGNLLLIIGMFGKLLAAVLLIFKLSQNKSDSWLDQ